MKRTLVLLLVLLAACREGGITADDAAKVVREAAGEMREKATVKIQVRLDKTEMPSEQDLQLRRQIEEAIENEEIGRVKVSDSGVGHIDVHVEVDSTAEAVPRIRELLETLGLLERSTVSVEGNG